MTAPNAAQVFGHDPDSVAFTDSWQIIEEEAWETFNDHVFDDVNTALARMREAVVLRAE